MIEIENEEDVWQETVSVKVQQQVGNIRSIIVNQINEIWGSIDTINLKSTLQNYISITINSQLHEISEALNVYANLAYLQRGEFCNRSNCVDNTQIKFDKQSVKLVDHEEDLILLYSCFQECYRGVQNFYFDKFQIFHYLNVRIASMNLTMITVINQIC